MDQDDFDLFRKAMEAEGVRQRSSQSETVRIASKKPLYPGKHQPPSSGQNEKDFDISDEASSPQTPYQIDRTFEGPEVLFARQGISKTALRHLKKGVLPVEESLDMHGMRQHEARRALEVFIAECLHYNMECVLIIHGKGHSSEQTGGILKPLTIQWLKQQTAVKAFCSAISRDGGSGATYVLLDQK